MSYHPDQENEVFSNEDFSNEDFTDESYAYTERIKRKDKPEKVFIPKQGSKKQDDYSHQRKLKRGENK